MSRPSRALLFVIITLCISCVTLLWFAATSDSDGVPSVGQTWAPPSEIGFVGDNACARCHDVHTSSFHNHPMSQSIRAVPSDLVVDASGPWRPERVDGRLRQLTVSIKNGGLWHGEHMVVDDETAFEQYHQMKFSIGSGQRATAFVRQDGDSLFASPLNWYAPTDSWDLNPGYLVDDPQRFDRRITEDCLGCHAGRVASLGRSEHRFEEQPFVQQGIGCENCHGPGEQHIRLMESGSDRMGIVNPSKLSFRQQEAVCYQCHLHTNYRILRAGRSHLDFRPGDVLEDIWLHVTLNPTKSAVVGKANSHVQQMRISRCYESGKLGCISCHDPHSRPSPDEKDVFYRSRCMECHESNPCSESADVRAQSGGSCIECHMPAATTRNIAHVSQTDHRILRSADSVSSAGQHELAQILDKGAHEVPEAEHDRAVALALWSMNSSRGASISSDVVLTLRKTYETNPQDWQVMLALGDIATGLKLPEQAEEFYNSCLKFPAAKERALTALLEQRYLNGQWSDVISLSDQFITHNTRYAPAWAMRAEAQSKLGNVALAIKCAEEALRLNPTLTEVREWMIPLLSVAGREEDARSMRRLVELIRRKESSVADDLRPPRNVE